MQAFTIINPVTRRLGIWRLTYFAPADQLNLLQTVCPFSGSPIEHTFKVMQIHFLTDSPTGTWPSQTVADPKRKGPFDIVCGEKDPQHFTVNARAATCYACLNLAFPDDLLSLPGNVIAFDPDRLIPSTYILKDSQDELC